MSFTADQYSQIAQGYDQAAADPLVTPEKKEEFAKKAKWFHFLAQRESQHARTLKEDVIPQLHGDAITASDSPRRSMAPFLTLLWLTGAVFYLFSTMLFTNAVNLFGDEDRMAVAEARRPVEASPKVIRDDIEAKEQNNRPVKPATERPHAISPDQPTYEDPALTVPPYQLPERELGVSSATERVQKVTREVFTVTADATIRISPSTSAKKIGTAASGAELVVTAREPDWVQFTDPSSGNSGWIHSSLVAPSSRAGGQGLATSIEAENRTVETPTAKPAKKRANAKPTTPTQATEQKRKYVELPDDEGFVSARRRGPGLLAKRRMLREGLLSPGFLPPR
jgi:Bacterial SH3 domain